MPRPRLDDIARAELEQLASRSAGPDGATIPAEGHRTDGQLSNRLHPNGMHSNGHSPATLAGVDGSPSSHAAGDVGANPHHLDQLSVLLAELHGLQQRQLHLGVIEQAKGMLMGYYGISADHAFAVLRRWSQHSNTKLRDVAAAFVAAGAQPSQHPYGGVRTALRQHSLDAAASQPPDVIMGEERVAG